MELFDATKSLITYVGALVILFFSFLWFLDRLLNRLQNREDDFDFEPLIAVFSTLIALLIILEPRAIDFWVSLAIATIAVATLIWMVVRQRVHGKWYFWVVTAIFVSLNIPLFWNDYQNRIYGVTIKAMLHSEESGERSIDEKLSALWEQNVAGKFKEKFGATVEIVRSEPNVTERLKEIQEFLEPVKQSGDPVVDSSNDIDVFAIDVVWPRVLADHAEDLSLAFGNLNEFIPAIVQNNTVDNKLVAVPWYIDVGVLFYRKTLLENYGYYQPPKTWDELEEMSKTIQEGERANGKRNFWGFVWQGYAYEGLTCNALEWQFSHGGGAIVSGNNNNLRVDIKEPAITAFEQARNWIWIDKISPPDVTEFQERDALQIWIQGNAAFMRHWPYAYLASSTESSFLKPTDIGVTLLPKGSGNNARHTSTFGGWQLMVNTHSRRKEKKAAIKFVEFLTSEEMQEFLATQTGKLPSLTKLYDQPQIQKVLPFIEDKRLKGLFMAESSDNALVQRPSTYTGSKYPDISEAYFNRVHEILKDNTEDTEIVVQALRSDVEFHLSANP